MSTSSRTPNPPLFVISSVPAAGRRRERSACGFIRLDLPHGTFHFQRLKVSHSTHGATVLLVFPTKSLKILLSGRTVVRTNPELLRPDFSRNARRPHLALFGLRDVRVWRPGRVSVPQVGGRYENE